MTNTKFNQRQEVLALSIANVVAGCFGGIPGTAALARTALNVKSGATSRVSGIICSAAVTFLSLILFPYFKFLPLPSVAAIVVHAALQMVDVEELQNIYHNSVLLSPPASPYLPCPIHPPPHTLSCSAGQYPLCIDTPSPPPPSDHDIIYEWPLNCFPF